MNNDEYMDAIFDSYDFYLSEKVDIYFHNLYKSANSCNYFNKIAKNKKNVVICSGDSGGIGIIKND
jgi:phosphoribosylpyrophosphate synthetase